MKIGVVGGGVVGSATARCFMENHEVMVYDLVPERATHGLPEVIQCDLVFVCLPTPQSKDGLAPDLEPLAKFFYSMSGLRTNFVLRSTVPVGTTRRLRLKYALPNLVHSPEFLTARCAFTDAQMPARNIIGCQYEGDNQSTPCANQLLATYQKRFPGVPVHLMTSDESEAVKLMLNSFFAVKVAYWNECNLLAIKLGLDWGRVMAGILSDGRIAHSHTTVPGPDGKYGFGGTCLPKDLANLIYTMQQNQEDDGERITGTTPHVCRAAYTRNVIDRERKSC